VLELAEEDRHHAGLAVRVLARPVDVAVAQHHVVGAVQAVVEADVLLGAVLGDAVGRHGGHRRVLGRGDPLRLAVEGAAGGGEDDARAHGPRRLEHLDGAAHVHVGVEPRVVDGHAHVGLRGQVQRRLRAEVAEQRAHAVAVADVGLLEARLGGHALALAGGEVVDHADIVPAREQRVGDVRADEAGTAGDEGADGHRGEG
jgi:hypothetical protein